MKMTHQQLKIKIESLVDPRTNKTLKSLNAVKGLIIENKSDTVVLRLELNEPTDSKLRPLKQLIAKLIKIELGFKGLKLDIVEAKNKPATKQRKYLAILSGKGGVGKTTIASNLAIKLQQQGFKIGLMDCDIFGASVAGNLDIPHQRHQARDEQIIPIKAPSGVEVVSASFLIDPDEAVVLRAPMVSDLLKHFFEKTLWSDDLDLIVIDMPPGTGDVLIDVMHLADKNLEAILVTTPDQTASQIALKSGYALLKKNITVMGVVENMSYLTLPNGERNFVFGQGGGELISEKLGVIILEQIPLAAKTTPEFQNAISGLATTVKTLLEITND